VQLNEPRLQGAVFKMEGGRFDHIGAELFPCLTLCEDGMPRRPCAKAAFFRIANLENQLHAI